MRNFLAGLSGGSGVYGAAMVFVILLAAGFFIQQGRESGETATPVAVPAPEPQTKTPPQTAVTDAQTPPQPETAVIDTAAATAPQTAAPEFDEVRRDPDGMTVIAGRAAPGARVGILQNGTEIATSTADASGKFATLTMIPPDGRGHSLTLVQVANGAEQTSKGEILLAPLAAPVVVAAATPDTQEVPVAAPETAPESGPETGPAPAEEQAPVSVTEVTGLQEQTQLNDITAETIAPPTPAAAPAPATTQEAGATTPTEIPSAPTPPVATATVDAPAPPQPPSDTAPQVQSTAGQQTIAALAPQTTAPARANAITPVGRIAPAPQTGPAPASGTAPTAILRSTEAGVELLNPSVSDVMDNVAIDTISYSDAGEVQLAGRAQPEATSVRIYLDNNAVVNLPVDAQGRWRGDVPDVDEGIYTLRIDEVTAGGDVSSRIETPFKREAPEVLIAAAAAASEGPIKAITVQKGATLWAIARDRYGDGALYVRVFEANKQAIRDPDLIYPGQIFELPQ